MPTPSAPPPQSQSPSEEFCDSIFDYRDRVDQLPDRQVRLRTIELDHGDGDVGIYDAAGNFLACEEGREEALREAEFVLIAYVNGARWAIGELAAGRGHLQRYFPEIAARHCCPPGVPNAPARVGADVAPDPATGGGPNSPTP